MDFKFEVNEGPIDRAVRAILGIALGAAAYMRFVSTPVDIILYLAGGLLLITSLTGFCLIYKLLGINTNKSAVSEPTPEKPSVSKPAASKSKKSKNNKEK